MKIKAIHFAHGQQSIFSTNGEIKPIYKEDIDMHEQRFWHNNTEYSGKYAIAIEYEKEEKEK